MTVKELIDVAVVDAVNIIVREHGCGKWLYAYKVGECVQVGKYDCIRDKDGVLKNVGKAYIPDNKIEVCRIDGQCRTLVIPKSLKYIPKEVQNLEIYNFRSSYVTTASERGMEIFCYPKGYFVPSLPFIAEKTDENQLSLFDIEED